MTEPQAAHVLDALRATERRLGAKTAITFFGADVDAPPAHLGYTALVDGVARTANALRALGLGPGDVVAYLLPSLPETQFVLWGAATAAAALPVNPLLQAGDIAALCRAAGARALVALGPLPGTEVWAKALAVRELAGIEVLVQVGGAQPQDGAHLFADLLRASPAELAFDDLPGADSVAAYFHTGGTTGAPRLVIHTHRNQLAAARGAAEAIALGEHDVLVNGLPMFHVAAAIFCSLAMFVAGAEMAILSPTGFRNPRVVAGFWRLVERARATLVGGVPTALAAVAQVDPAGADLSRVRLNLSGASLLPRAVAERLETLTGRPVREIYGMTEAAGVICVDRVDRPRVIGSAGHPIAGCAVQARRLGEDGQAGADACAPGEPGVLVVRGANVTPGDRGPERSRGLFTADGWLVTGDLGYVDADGRVFITGRAKDLIIRGGHNIDPVLVEDCLLRHPAVAEAAAVGMPDAYAGEVPVAYVTLRAGAAVSEADLLAFAQAGIAEPPAKPRRVFVRPQLPMTAVGKIFKPALRVDCARQHIAGLLAAEPVARLSVEDDPAQGRLVHVALHAQADTPPVRARIGAALAGYALAIRWAPAHDGDARPQGDRVSG